MTYNRSQMAKVLLENGYELAAVELEVSLPEGTYTWGGNDPNPSAHGFGRPWVRLRTGTFGTYYDWFGDGWRKASDYPPTETQDDKTA